MPVIAQRRPGILRRPAPVVVGGVTVTWNTGDAGPSITFSGGNLTASNVPNAWNTVRATLSKSTGQRYLEMPIVTVGAGLAFGFAITGGTLTNPIGSLGISSGAYDPPGTTTFFEGGFSNSISISPTFANGDVPGLAVDLDAGKLWFAKNNSYTAFNAGANPATGANPSLTFTPNLVLFPALSLFGTNTVTLAASGTFAFSPPSGFVAWNA